MPYKRYVLLLSALLGCADPPEASLEAPSLDARLDEPLVLASAALDNGPPWFGANVQAELSARTPLQAWTFELPSAATLRFATRGTATGPDVDTVLYLYRQGARGWGSYLARNDDAAGSVFSSLARALQPGRYRVVVKGRTREVSGPFALSAACEGVGCQLPEPPQACVFGSRVTELARRLRVSNILTFTSAEQLPDALARTQLVSSAAQLPGARIGSAEQLFARVDGGLVRWMRIWDDAGGRRFVAYEYRIDDHSYGAIFVEAGDLAAGVQDGLLVDCRVPVERCALGSTYPELRRDPRFELLASAELDARSAAALSPLAQAQLLEAVRVAYDDAADLAVALESVDGGRVYQILLNQIATGRQIVVYEYGAGDNSFGGVFGVADAALLARIEDGALVACSLRE